MAFTPGIQHLDLRADVDTLSYGAVRTATLDQLRKLVKDHNPLLARLAAEEISSRLGRPVDFNT